MTSQNLYSIRMRASSGNRHISGAERLVAAERINSAVREMTDRALAKGCAPDQIVISVDSLNGNAIRTFTALDVITLDVPEVNESREIALRILTNRGVSSDAARNAVRFLSAGAAPSGGNMRGAMILDSLTGERLGPDRERGIRVSRFDWRDDALGKIDQLLSSVGLTHFRTREALALATKAAHAPGIVAELCWSDDPDYTAGYVASLKTGYVRFPFMKQKGDDKGGRVFFVLRNEFDKDRFMQYLQKDAVLITDVGSCRPAISSEEYYNSR